MLYVFDKLFLEELNANNVFYVPCGPILIAFNLTPFHFSFFFSLCYHGKIDVVKAEVFG